jgi:cell division protease FtsH
MSHQPTPQASSRPEDQLPQQTSERAPVADGVGGKAAEPADPTSGARKASGWPRLSIRRDDPPRRPPWRVEGMTGEGADKDGRRANWKRFWLAMLVMLAVNWTTASLLLAPEARVTVSYTYFVSQVDARNVQEVTSTGDTIEGTFRQKVTYPPGAKKDQQVQVTRFSTQRPSFADDDLFRRLQATGVAVNANSPDRVPFWQQLLFGFGPTLLLVGGTIWLWRRMAAGGGVGGLGGKGGFGGMGQSRAKRYDKETSPRTTFADVAGIPEVENEVREIVDYLKEPERYTKLGAQIPRGVLLSGQPGTGKTLLARAVAGEADVPFFSISASEFIEMIVGVGASRVRDLFDQAKQVAPAIIFIDELDAIGRARGGSSSVGGHDEREQTLNQILTEMDGFTGNEGVVVLAATNRPEVLDSALLRPGRFDRQVTVSPPDLAGRRQILAVHTRAVPLAADVNLDTVAATTPGMVGADLKNLVNEAALLAARRGHTQVTATDISESMEKIVLGTVRGIVLSSEEKERTAYHESGHALLGMLTPGADPVRKISIIPRGRALGVTYQSPESDRYGYSADYLRGRIVGALGGRAAEEIVYGDVTTGAENDLEHVSSIARQMVGRWGMSSTIGPVSVLPPPGQESPLGLDGVAPATKELVDREVRQIVEECYERAVSTLREHREQLDALTARLLEREALDEDDAYAAAGMPPATAPGGIVPSGRTAQDGTAAMPAGVAAS